MGDRGGLLATLFLAAVLGAGYYALADGPWTETFPAKVQMAVREGPRADDAWVLRMLPAEGLPVNDVMLQRDRAEKIQEGDDVRITRTVLKPYGLERIRFEITRDGAPVDEWQEGRPMMLVAAGGTGLLIGAGVVWILAFFRNLLRREKPFEKVVPTLGRLPPV